ncbi:hypothetical protein [Bhargavaea cecembensis]|uniref:hypothetical protein n=1 Tax=Bhargavaea cecembensis TaxID=394098 RepID=UPI00211D6218|nr:hypothetical protein [Bhargavaea cecembensis]
MKIIIKEYDQKDEIQLKMLLDLSFGEEYLLSIVRNSKFAYSAFDEERLVGVAFGWLSSFHPYCTYFRILCNPLYTMTGVEEKLLGKIESLETIDLPLQTSIWETSVNIKELYDKNGFKEIRRTYMPTLQVYDLKEGLKFDDEKSIY